MKQEENRFYREKPESVAPIAMTEEQMWAIVSYIHVVTGTNSNNYLASLRDLREAFGLPGSFPVGTTMSNYFVFRDGAFGWVHTLLEGDIDFTHNDSAEDAQKVVDAYYKRRIPDAADSLRRDAP